MNNIVIQKKTSIALEQGVYEAVISSIEQTTGTYGEQLRWKFRLGDDLELSGWTSMVFSESSKLFKWYSAAMGHEFNPTADFNSSFAIGKTVQIDVSIKVGTDGSQYNKVEAVLPLPKQRLQPPKVAVQTPPMPEPSPTGEAIPW